METVVKFQEQVICAADPNALNAAFQVVAAQFGFAVYAGGELVPYNPREPFLLINWPKGWLELYAAQGFAADDIAVHSALQSPETFTWTELKQRYPGASGRIFAAAAEYGWTEGLVVPVHGPGTRRGIISLAGSAPPIGGAARALIETVAILAYERAREFSGTHHAAADKITPREEQVLTEIAAGRSDAAIAAVLGISRTTAHFHAENARRKLGAATRAQAVALAIKRGIVRL